MIQANRPIFSCTSDMSLTIYGIIFSGPLMHTDTPSGTGVYAHAEICRFSKERATPQTVGFFMIWRASKMPHEVLFYLIF